MSVTPDGSGSSAVKAARGGTGATGLEQHLLDLIDGRDWPGFYRAYVPLNSTEHHLVLNDEAVRAGAQTDLDDLGIAKNAREEKLAAQARKHKTPEELAQEAAKNAEMAKLYRQHVLKEQPTLQIQGLGGKKNAQEPAGVLHKPVV